MPSTDRRPALFLDRDGVINREVQYLYRPDDLELLPGAAAAIASVNALGVPVVVVTNQAGIGRGLFKEDDFHALQALLEQRLADAGAHLDGRYFCPHHPVHGVGPYRVACECRKPRPGMLLRAARELSLDLSRSLMVGDKASDLEAGRAAGCATALVRTGYGADVEASWLVEGRAGPWDAVFDSLGAAAPFLAHYFPRRG